MKNINFINIIKNLLAEKNQTLDILFDNNVVSENTFYKYRQRMPSIETVAKIANFIEVSLDYMFDFSDENNFHKFVYKPEIFYRNLMTYIKNKNLSGRQFCKELGFCNDNLLRWKNGTKIGLAPLLEITKFFECTLEDLLL